MIKINCIWKTILSGSSLSAHLHSERYFMIWYLYCYANNMFSIMDREVDQTNFSQKSITFYTAWYILIIYKN